MPTHVLRQATRADFLFMQETKLDGMRPYVEAVWGWNQQEQEQLFAEKFDAAGSRIIVVDATDVGFIVVEDGETIFLAGIYIAAAMRGCGIGTAVLRELIEQAIRHGNALTLRVLKVNPARGLYERLGFSITSETETHFMMRWSASGAIQP